MARIQLSLIIAALFILIGRSLAPTNPTLVHDTSSGRIFVAKGRSQTLSVLWDQTVQDIVAALKVGPTIASGGYAKMHTAIFESWHYFEVDTSRTIETEKQQKAAMSLAAYSVVSTTFPAMKDVATQRLDELLHELNLSHESFLYARLVADRKASLVMDRYNRDTTSIGEFPLRSSIEKWAPEHVPIDDPTASRQKFLTLEWGRRYTFAVPDGSSGRPSPPQPFLLVNGTLDMRTATINLDDGQSFQVNHTLVGSIINPAFIRQAEQVVSASYALNDRTKFIAELWEGGGGTSFPPGIWMTFGQWVSMRDMHTNAQDARMFLALSNAIYDAGVLTWNAKKYYSYARPVRMIRDLSSLRLIGRFDSILKTQLIDAYDLDTGNAHSIPGERFESFQRRSTGASPPFPEYTSGHSAFSAAAAEVLRRWTGSDRFGAHVTLDIGKSLFELGRAPLKPVTLEWKTFTEAAIEAGNSRVFGAIHFEEGNVRGISLGRFAGEQAFIEAERLYTDFGQQSYK